MKKDQTDVYQKITDQIIQAIENGAADYEMPWNRRHGNGLLPLNAETGKPYRGVNIIALWATQQDKGYQSNEWATFKQWQEKGAQVRKGEKATHIVFWSFIDKDAQAAADNGEAATDEDNRRMFARSYAVFNADQVDGYTPATIIPEVTTSNSMERIPEVDHFFDNLGADLRHGGSQAYYSPSNDYIQMPLFEDFKTVEGYYSVLAHESTHWTGANKRLARDLKGRFGDNSYAMEELIAELGAAFTMANIGLSNEPRTDHASYIQSWLKVLKDDKKAIFTASSKAQAAADFLLEQQLGPDLAAALDKSEPQPDTGPAFTLKAEPEPEAFTERRHQPEPLPPSPPQRSFSL